MGEGQALNYSEIDCDGFKCSKEVRRRRFRIGCEKVQQTSSLKYDCLGIIIRFALHTYRGFYPVVESLEVINEARSLLSLRS